MAKKKAKKKKEVKKKTSKPKPKPEQIKVTPQPTAGQKIIDFEQKLDEQISGVAPEPKRGPGRPRKEPEPIPDIANIDNKIIKDAVQVPFDLWARSQGINNLRLTDDEAEQISAPIKTLLDYYLPEVPAIAYAWGALVITAYTLVSPRLFMLEQIRKDKSAKSENLRDQADRTRTSQNKDGSAGPPGRFPNQHDIKPIKIKH